MDPQVDNNAAALQVEVVPAADLGVEVRSSLTIAALGAIAQPSGAQELRLAQTRVLAGDLAEREEARHVRERHLALRGARFDCRERLRVEDDDG